MKGEQKNNLNHLLHRLNSADAGSAWAEFVDDYMSQIMKTGCRSEYQQDRSNECFAYVCEKLSDQQFRRLQKFNVAGKASFQTWLGTVTSNLCVDWHRSQFGRVQLLSVITALPIFDQKVYRFSFEQAMSLETSFQSLKEDFPEITRQQLSSAISRIHDALSPRQRWQINVRNRRRGKNEVDLDLLPGSEVEPQNIAELLQASEDLQRAMGQLTQDQQLLLDLRFRQGLTLKKIAKIMQLGDPFRVRRKLQVTLDQLSESMQAVFSSGKR